MTKIGAFDATRPSYASVLRRSLRPLPPRRGVFRPHPLQQLPRLPGPPAPHPLKAGDRAPERGGGDFLGNSEESPVSVLASLLFAWLVVIPAAVVMAATVGGRVREQRLHSLFAAVGAAGPRACE